MAFCTACGRELPENVNFCPICGEKTELCKTADSQTETICGTENVKSGEPANSENASSETVTEQNTANAGSASEEDTANVNAEAFTEQNTVNVNNETGIFGNTSGNYTESAALICGNDCSTKSGENMNSENKSGMSYTVIDDDPSAGDGRATAALVLGIISVVFCCSTLISIVCGIIGLVCASKAKKLGINNGKRKAGFVLSLIGLILGALVFVIGILVIGVVLALF